MNRPSDVARDEAVPTDRWLLLIHQIPPKPDYLRVKIGRRLQQIGAVPIKNSVYVLPDSDRAREDFQWVRAEIVDGGGSGSICRADFVDGLTNEQLRDLFRNARDADYAEITVAARALLAPARSKGKLTDRARRAPAADAVTRLRDRFISVRAIDWFVASEQAVARQMLDRAAAAHGDRTSERTPEAGSAVAFDVTYRGRTWVTRESVFVDRIASAWFIRRFVDPEATLRFVPADDVACTPNEVRFDMFKGEFTHRGDRCTFEVLCERFAPGDPALASIAEIVHDIDMRDEKFGRSDAAGVERVLRGITASLQDDEQRVARGGQLFDDLYASLVPSPPVAPPAATPASRGR